MTTGFFTLTDLVNAKILTDRAQLDSARITDLITSDLATRAKFHMAEGTRYYNSDHDILQYVPTYFVDGKATQETSKSNYKLPHPFHQVLVDQKASYIVGNPVVVSVAEPDIEDPNNPTPKEQSAIDETDKFGEILLDEVENRFDDLLHDWVIGASNKGVEWAHFYILPPGPKEEKEKKAGRLEYCIIPAEQIIPVYDSQYQQELMYVIRFYQIDMVDEKGVSTQRFKVEWWGKDNVEYWAQDMAGIYVHDPDHELAGNTTGHWIETNTSKPGEKESHSWGRVPFVPLMNNSQGHTDLRPVKALIDAYDLVKSGWLNDLKDFQELLYVLKGYDAGAGDKAQGYAEILANLKNHKIVLTSEDGAVDTVKAEIPVEAKEKFLAITRKEIFYFGQGVDIDDENLGAASGIALKFRYTGLDLKADKMIRKLKTALTEFMWFLVEFINRRDGSKYDSSEVLFTINKSVIFNEKEKIDSLVASEGMLSKKTLLENHPYVDDVDEEMKRRDAEEQDRIDKGMVDLANVRPVDANGDPVKPPVPDQPMPPAKKNGKKMPVPA